MTVSVNTVKHFFVNIVGNDLIFRGSGNSAFRITNSALRNVCFVKIHISVFGDELLALLQIVAV